MIKKSLACVVGVALLALPGAAHAQEAPADSGDTGAVEEWPTGKEVAVWSLVGVSAVTFGVGAYFGVKALGKKGDREDLLGGRPAGFCKPTESNQREYGDLGDEQQEAALTGSLFYAAGVASGLGALLVAHFWENEAPRTTAAVAPTREGFVLGIRHAF